MALKIEQELEIQGHLFTTYESLKSRILHIVRTRSKGAAQLNQIEPEEIAGSPEPGQFIETENGLYTLVKPAARKPNGPGQLRKLQSQRKTKVCYRCGRGDHIVNFSLMFINKQIYLCARQILFVTISNRRC